MQRFAIFFGILFYKWIKNKLFVWFIIMSIYVGNEAYVDCLVILRCKSYIDDKSTNIWQFHLEIVTRCHKWVCVCVYAPTILLYGTWQHNFYEDCGRIIWFQWFLRLDEQLTR